MSKVTAVIIDDSAFFREMLRDICNELDISIQQEFIKGDDFLKDLENGVYQDIEMIFLDINMPGRSGKELLPLILDLSSESIVIMISTLKDIATVNECLDMGASNYINKNSSISDMKAIIEDTMQMNGL